MKAVTKILLIILLAQSFFGCRWISGAGTAYFAWTNFKVPDGSPTFQTGFKDGCSSVLYARGNDYYRSRYKYKYDPAMIGNTEYRFGHQRGYTWCFQYVLAAATGPSGAPDKFIFAAPVFDPTFTSVNSAWFFASDGSAFGSDATASPAGGLDSMFGVFQKGNGAGGVGGGGESAFTGNPFWAGGSKGQFLGWSP